MAASGSSPPARGTPGPAIRRGDVLRFIPARAGNTVQVNTLRSAITVHPRPRGEHALWSFSRCSLIGSSPPARGTRDQVEVARPSHRFIPARAGNTRSTPAGRITGPVHPRPRGEHCCRIRHSLPTYGSSPPARGTPLRVAQTGAYRRFIPARAGNTFTRHRQLALASVHPRPRGEHDGEGQPARESIGSSPPARGTHVRAAGAGVRRRFIPARAGNTRDRPARSIWPPVHPRPRGEHLVSGFGRRLRNGSSPPARGTPRERIRAASAKRFIPARAGNTHRPRPSRCRCTVHPRPRGEHDLLSTPRPPANGSSPPARGTPQEPRHAQLIARFIPARAGNTGHSTGARSPSRGSSPPARGTPARAGRRGHPRPRGEHVRLRCSVSNSFWPSPPARGTLFPQDIDSKGVAAHQRPHQLRSPDPGEEAMARSRRVAPRFQLVPRWAVAARIARA